MSCGPHLSDMSNLFGLGYLIPRAAEVALTLRVTNVSKIISKNVVTCSLLQQNFGEDQHNCNRSLF